MRNRLALALIAITALNSFVSIGWFAVLGVWLLAGERRLSRA